MKAHGIIVALHTPLTPSGEIHEEALRDHLEWMVRSGIHGIFPCGTMVRALPSLTRSESASRKSRWTR